MYDPAMALSPAINEWNPASWQAKPAQQQPRLSRIRRRSKAWLRHSAACRRIVVSWRSRHCEPTSPPHNAASSSCCRVATVPRVSAECESDQIAQKLKILLQMSLVLLDGLKKPIVRVGRMAGQYAKPRSADTETRDGVTLPSYRGDIVNRAPVHASRSRAGS